MNRFTSRALYGALLVGGLSLLGATAANAADTTGNDSLVGGNQTAPAVSAPVTVGGNAISVIGDSSSTGSTTSAPAAAPAPASTGSTTSGDDGIAGGNQVEPDASAPVTVGGNALSVLGDADSNGASSSGSTTSGSNGSTTTGDEGTAGGNQIAPDASAPVTVGGNAISVTGDSSTSGTTSSGASAPESDGSSTPGDVGVDTDSAVIVGLDVDANGVVDPPTAGNRPPSAIAPGASGDGEATVALRGGVAALDALALTGPSQVVFGAGAALISLMSGLGVLFGARRMARRA